MPLAPAGIWAGCCASGPPMPRRADTSSFSTRQNRSAPRSIHDGSRRGSSRAPAGTWWEQVRVPSVAPDDHLDVFFAPAYTAPLRMRVPTVVAIHDLSFVAHPEWFGTREGVAPPVAHAAVREAGPRHRHDFGVFTQRADRFAGASRRARPRHPARRERRRSAVQALAREERVLFVGSIFNRRHVPGPGPLLWHRRAAPPAGVARSRRRQPDLSTRGHSAHDCVGGARRPRMLAPLRLGRPASRPVCGARARLPSCPSTKASG